MLINCPRTWIGKCFNTDFQKFNSIAVEANILCYCCSPHEFSSVGSSGNGHTWTVQVLRL